MTLTSIGPAGHMMHSAGTHPLTWRLHEDTQPVWPKEYQSKDGYTAARKALTRMAQNDVVQTVKDSDLRGRGGTDFPTGVKWGLISKGESLNIRYLLCNTGGMELNTWENRMFMEQLSHLLMEGMLISTRALKAYRSYISLYGKYVGAAHNLNRAIDEAKAADLLSKNILGNGFDLELFVYTDAGRHTCGEETTLINSLEGHRANPRSKPPFPAAVDVWGRPTYVNSVETLRNVSAIVGNSVDWYKILARPGSGDMGIEPMNFSGKVKNLDLWELPFGVSARRLFEDYAGSMRDGFQLKAWQPSSADTGFLLSKHLDAQMFTGGVAEVGTRMDTGLAMVVDDGIDMVSLLRSMKEFFAHESCGWCTPCCGGLPQSVKLLRTLERGEGQPDGLEILGQSVNFLDPGRTFCAHAPGAVGPLGSALKHSYAEFKTGISRQSSVASRPAMVDA